MKALKMRHRALLCMRLSRSRSINVQAVVPAAISEPVVCNEVSLGRTEPSESVCNYVS